MSIKPEAYLHWERLYINKILDIVMFKDFYPLGEG